VGGLGAIKRLDLRKDFSDDLPPVRGDRAQLEQVFRNLIHNASQAMEESVVTELTVTSRYAPDRRCVEVTISDTGCGIPDEYRGSQLAVRIHLDDTFRVYAGETVVAHHRKRPASEGWVTVPGHHEKLWRETLRVEQRDLRVYEEVAGCSS